MPRLIALHCKQRIEKLFLNAGAAKPVTNIPSVVDAKCRMTPRSQS